MDHFFPSACIHEKKTRKTVKWLDRSIQYKHLLKIQFNSIELQASRFFFRRWTYINKTTFSKFVEHHCCFRGILSIHLLCCPFLLATDYLWMAWPRHIHFSIFCEYFFFFYFELSVSIAQSNWMHNFVLFVCKLQSANKRIKIHTHTGKTVTNCLRSYTSILKSKRSSVHKICKLCESDTRAQKIHSISPFFCIVLSIENHHYWIRKSR